MYAYVLISLSEPNEQKILERLESLDEVDEAHILFGEWDLLVKLKCKSAEEIGTFVMERIRTLEDVNLTSTLIVAR